MLDFHCSSRKSKLFLPLILFTAGLLTTLLQAVFMVILSTKVPSGENGLILFCSMTACTIVFHVVRLTRMVKWSQMEHALLTSSSSHT